jgi:polyhydroxybutyrate depolymerase
MVRRWFWPMVSVVVVACASGSVEKPSAGADSGMSAPTEPVDSGDATETGDAGPVAPPRTLGSGVHTLEYDGQERSFHLHVPDGVEVGAPLLLALHGYSSSGATLQEYSGFDALADANGFVVVYPSGTRDRWGDRYWEVGYDFHDGSVDDVGFLRALAAVLVADQGLDASRIYSTGMSNGGDMSYRIGCEAPDLVAAIAPVAGMMMDWLAASCSPADPVPVLEIHGTADDITRWDGDPENRGGWGVYLSTEDGLAHWVNLHGMDTYDETPLPNTSTSDGSDVLVRTWSRSGTRELVQLYQVNGGGHDWPGAWGNRDMSASETVWSFVSQYP